MDSCSPSPISLLHGDELSLWLEELLILPTIAALPTTSAEFHLADHSSPRAARHRQLLSDFRARLRAGSLDPRAPGVAILLEQILLRERDHRRPQ